MRKLMLLLLVLPFLVLGAPPASGRDVHHRRPTEPITGQVGTEFTYFITVTDCASSNKQPYLQGRRRPPSRGYKAVRLRWQLRADQRSPHDRRYLHFTVQVKDETRATDTQTFRVEILPAEAPTITTETLSNGTVGEFYCCGNLFASGGVQPYTWSVVAGALPPGLELPKRENTISGTPTTAGTFTFTVRVTDDLGAF